MGGSEPEEGGKEGVGVGRGREGGASWGRGACPPGRSLEPRHASAVARRQHIEERGMEVK